MSESIQRLESTQSASVEIVSKSKAPERVFFVDEIVKYGTIDAEVKMPIPTLLAKILGLAPWKVGCIKEIPPNNNDFILGEEIIFLRLGDGMKVWAHKMPKVGKRTHFANLHTRLIRDGVQIPSSCITARPKG